MAATDLDEMQAILDALESGAYAAEPSDAQRAQYAADDAALVERQRAADAAKCKRCAGMGYIPGYAHVNGGKCFGCGGSGRNS